MARPNDRLKIGVVGTGISGMAAAWLLSQAHDVTVYEQAGRTGGHSHTVDVMTADGSCPVDMGFIVYNPPAYPNLTALFRHLDVPTQPSEMSFAVSLRDGGLEYAGTDLAGLFAQKRNLLRPRFWRMLRDLLHFYRHAARDAHDPALRDQSLGDYLAAGRYGSAFVQDHLLPMAAAIWSTPVARVGAYPAASFLRFFANHGLLRLRDRPQWRTVSGGSRLYVDRLTKSYAERIHHRRGVRRIHRETDRVRIIDTDGTDAWFDHVVIATHADQALAMLAVPSDHEALLLRAIRYTSNEAVMHRDRRLMPRRRRAWCSWNYVSNDDGLCVTYWMNRLQSLADSAPVFVTLNPRAMPAPGTVIHRETFAHPAFDGPALRAQRALWSLQGQQRTWFCGAYFGAGFHEDGLQSGLAVAEALGGVRRPWRVEAELGRIHLTHSALAPAAA